MAYKKTKEQFLEKCHLKHGDKYDYSLVEYNGWNEKVKIICKKHGIYEQTPSGHISGRSCYLCGIKSKTSTTESFLKKCKLIHGEKYDYSLVNYINNHTNVDIICKEHGIFKQTPNTHTDKKSNCPTCSGCEQYTSTTFIKKSKRIHGDYYSYDKVNYINLKNKVIITCPIHGDFKQLPSNHFKYDCIKCTGTLRLTKKEFIRRSNEIHGNLYNYSKVRYANVSTYVDIICKKHGIFKQTPDNHMRNRGCPSCKSSRGELKIEKF